MIVKASFSEKYDAVMKRIKRLPFLIDKSVNTLSRKDAEGFIMQLQDGIRNNTFNLEPLKPETIAHKKKMGFSKPSSPLYGEGDDEARALVNTLKIKKTKNGYKVFRSWAKHYASGLPLRVLWAIHEEGAVIDRGGKLIRIPPRPVFLKAFNRFMRKKRQKENVQKVREAINLYIRTGSLEKLQQFTSGIKRSEFDET